jgi:hypothetical protein
VVRGALLAWAMAARRTDTTCVFAVWLDTKSVSVQGGNRFQLATVQELFFPL